MLLIYILIIIIFSVIYYSINKSPQIKEQQKSNTIKNIKKQILCLDIVGVSYKNLSYSDGGKFIGCVKNESNSHDKYAVPIYKEHYNHIGYIPKGNKYISDYIKTTTNKEIPVWGELNNIGTPSIGQVYIPIGYDSQEEQDIIKILNMTEYIFFSSYKNATIDYYFEILDEHLFILIESKNLKISGLINYKFPKGLIPNILKLINKSGTNEDIIKLENYMELINLLNDKTKISIINKINKAKIKFNLI